jgi:hypothetical protein
MHDTTDLGWPDHIIDEPSEHRELPTAEAPLGFYRGVLNTVLITGGFVASGLGYAAWVMR